MSQWHHDKKVINDYCIKLGVTPRVDEVTLKTFYEMQWDVKNDVHVFAFISCLSLLDAFELPVLVTSHYPENVIKAINTFALEDNEEGLYNLLIREFLIVDSSIDLASILANFTLTLIGIWKLNIDPHFI